MIELIVSAVGAFIATLQSKVFFIVKIAFPIALIICSVSMLFTKDPKKLETEKKILIVCCLVYAILYFVVRGEIVGKIVGLFRGSGVY